MASSKLINNWVYRRLLLAMARRRSQRQVVLIAAVSLLLSASGLEAQSQPPLQPQTRETYERFLATDRLRLPAMLPANVLGEVTKAQEQVKKAPGMKASQARILEVQNQRVPLTDRRSASNYAQLLAEVSASDKPEYAQVLFWNAVALDATAFDHTPQLQTPVNGMTPTPRVIDQIGPARTSRALAIAHLAMFEAINFPEGKYITYHNIRTTISTKTGYAIPTDPAGVSARHAIAFAAYGSLSALYPGQQQFLDRMLLLNLTSIQEPLNRIAAGTAIGQAAAEAILSDRHLDGSEIPEPPATDFSTTDPDKWQRDPLNADPDRALGAFWRYVRPFVISTPDQFRPPPPPTKDRQDYKDAFLEVFKLGGDPLAGPTNPPGNTNRRPTATDRTPQQEINGKFWAYDATPLLCAPPRLYNMVATSLLLNEKSDSFTDAIDLARFLAILNITMADAAVSAWEAKYYYLYPRPVTAIRAATPTNAPLAQAAPFWTPLGAPVSNGAPGRVNFTPPFPAYPSGHAVFGGAVFEILRKQWGDGVKFTFISDEYNGLNSDAGAPSPRPKLPQTFMTFTAAESANAQSRIYLGIHWQFDAKQGIQQGNKVADHVLANLYMKAN